MDWGGIDCWMKVTDSGVGAVSESQAPNDRPLTEAELLGGGGVTLVVHAGEGGDHQRGM